MREQQWSVYNIERKALNQWTEDYHMRNGYLTIASVLMAALLAVSSVSAAPVTSVTFDTCAIKLKLDVPAHAATFDVSGVMRTAAGWNAFQLTGTAAVEMFSINRKPVAFLAVHPGDTAGLPTEVREGLAGFDTDSSALVILFKADGTSVNKFMMTYRAEFNQDVANMRFSNERVGAEVEGTILDKGAYLSPGAYYYPQGTEGLAQFSLTADIPETWESISDGNLVSSETKDGRKIQSWESPYKSDGAMFMAAPYVVKSIKSEGVDVYCYFFAEDTSLFEQYLGPTAKYISMYTNLIGPYPFKRFTVAENFFPTGYGMPAWTLLGQQVLRLPFIVSTSLGHEVLHNWWGNSVYVDYSRGNWCEGATVYGADYRYKLMQSPSAARDYRKDILKQYVNYVNSGNDFPLRDFRSRTSPETRTIGYNKAMMVYHMIEEQIGTGSFFDAWKLVYNKYKGQQISWEEWIKAFEETSGQPLDYVIGQWIDRAGAPVIALDMLDMERDEDQHYRTVRFSLDETGGQEYRLLVPVRFTGEHTTFDTSVVLDAHHADYTMMVPDDADVIEVDPDYDLFRKLYPEEVEPVISATLGSEKKRFVSYDAESTADDGFQSFAANLSDDGATVDDPDVFQDDDRSYTPVLLNPPELPVYLADVMAISDDSVSINGVDYPRAGHTFVLAGEDWNAFENFLVVLSDNYGSLPRLGQLVPHYGKYSFLVFDGTHNVGKGQWTVTESPLKQQLSEE